MTTTAAAAGTRRHTGTYPAEPRQVGAARAALAGWLAGCPQADEAVPVASEFATNSVLYSASRHGGAFTLRAEVSRDRLRIEVEDGGGGPRSGGLPHPHQMVWRTPYTEPRRRAAEAARKARRPSAFSAAQARTRPTAEELRQLSGSSLNRSPLRR